MTKIAIAVGAFFLVFFASFGASKLQEEIYAGDDLHSELFRLRGDVYRVRNMLIITNGLLGAIVAALLFS